MNAHGHFAVEPPPFWHRVWEAALPAVLSQMRPTGQGLDIPALSHAMDKKLCSPAFCLSSAYDNVYVVFIYIVRISNMLTSLDKCKKAVTSSLSLESLFIL